jgi:hypothetical protein
MRRVVTLAIAVASVLPAVWTGPAAATQYRTQRPVGSSGAVAGDFDDDGFADLAIGVPGEDLGTAVDAGAVQILYGSPAGLTADGNQLLAQTLPGLGAPETGDRFGSSLASGDYDGDGHSDLAIGVPGEDVGTTPDAGRVQVVFGTDDGLNVGGSQTINGNELNDRFGTVLAWANFGRGPQADLAIGTPEENVAGKADAGEVQVLYGSPAGLDVAGRQVVNQNAGALGPPEAFDRFGAALAGGDLGATGLADLAIAAPTEDVGDLTDAGQVQVLYGSSTGLKVAGASPVLDSVPEVNDQFGFALATGNFDGTGKQDLAIGVPREDVIATDHGVVAIALGQAAGIAGVTRLIIEQAPADGPGAGDQFGRSLAANDFDRDGITDLVVGIPFEDRETPGREPQGDIGAVLVFRGTPTARPEPVQVLFEIFPQSGDKFGAALTAWNFGAGPAPDLVVGAPFDNPFNLVGKTTNDAGSVHAFYSSGDTGALFDPAERDFYVQDSSVIPDAGEPGDQFGGAVY